MRKFFAIIFFFYFSIGTIFSQTKNKNTFAKSLEGHYNGPFMSKKKSEFGTRTLFLKYSKKNVLVSEKSPFGIFEVTVKEEKKDTIFFNSSVKDMKIKYIKSSKRLTIIGKVDGQIVNFSGKYSHKDEKDLAIKKMRVDSLSKIERGKTKYYGIFYGTLVRKNADFSVMDTIVVKNFEKQYLEGDYSILEKMASISSKGNHFKEFDTNVKILNDGQIIIQHKNNSLIMKLDYDSKTFYFEDNISGMKFEGIEVQGKSIKK